MKSRLLRVLESRWLRVLATLGFLALIGFLVWRGKGIEAQAEELYIGKTIPIDAGVNHPAKLQVESVSITGFFYPFIRIAVKGPLILTRPEAATLLEYREDRNNGIFVLVWELADKSSDIWRLRPASVGRPEIPGTIGFLIDITDIRVE